MKNINKIEDCFGNITCDKESDGCIGLFSDCDGDRGGYLPCPFCRGNCAKLKIIKDSDKDKLNYYQYCKRFNIRVSP